VEFFESAAINGWERVMSNSESAIPKVYDSNVSLRSQLQRGLGTSGKFKRKANFHEQNGQLMYDG